MAKLPEHIKIFRVLMKFRRWGFTSICLIPYEAILDKKELNELGFWLNEHAPGPPSHRGNWHLAKTHECYMLGFRDPDVAFALKMRLPSYHAVFDEIAPID